MNLKLINNDCVLALKNIEDNSIDSCVTDPPYGLSDHKKNQIEDCLKSWLSQEAYAPKNKGFMNKEWDSWVPGPEVWREVYRVLKPGGHALVFAGTRSMDLMCMALRLSGFELRDSIGYAHNGDSAPLLAWCYGSGFPKSHNISKAIDKISGVKFKAEPASGVGFMNPDGSGGYNVTKNKLVREGESTEDAKKWEGWGTALKPAWEPIILVRKPFNKTVVDNILEHRTGGLNIDACRVLDGTENGEVKPDYKPNNKNNVYGSGMGGGEWDNTNGRWPANIAHDGSDEVLSLFSKQKSGANPKSAQDKDCKQNRESEKGSAGRFFYCAKASREDREEGLEEFVKREPASDSKKDDELGRGTSKTRQGWARSNHHPTVKPTELMKYLCRLITPPNGVVLDPFMGSGSTGKGAVLEGFSFIGIEREKDYFEIAEARIKAASTNH